MVSHVHEALVELFRQRPSLAAELLADQLGAAMPTYESARLEACDLTDVAPTEYRADSVVVLTDAGRSVMAVVVEVQLRSDPQKKWSWPVYLTTLRARLKTPTMLMVLCPDPAVARRCAGPIEIGHPGWTLRPRVLGPDRVPVVTDPEEVGRSPGLAVLSAMAHGAEPEGDRVLSALLAGMRFFDRDQLDLYTDLVLAALSKPVRARLEELMTTAGTYEYKSDFARHYFGKGRAEGRAEGEAKALLRVLAARGIDVSEAARARITECADLDQLERWLDRAVVVNSAEELFAS